MKNWISLLLLISTAELLLAQSYVSLPRENVSWKTAYYTPDACGWPILTGKSLIYTYGDTIVQSDTMTKVYSKNANQLGVFEAKYLGAYIEDSMKRVYFIQKDSLDKQLLYDFAVDVGDTLTNLFEFAGSHVSDTFIVFQVDTFPIVDLDHPQLGRRWIHLEKIHNHGNNYPGAIWIEGVGSAIGFLPNYDPEFEWRTDFTCYTIDGNAYLFDTECNPLSVERASLSEKEIVYTNPVTRFLEIDLIRNNTGPIEVSLFNLMGELVIHKLFQPSEDLSIDCILLKDGIYILGLQSENSNPRTHKILVQH